jgi:glucose/arabinose dehydrogenase
VRRSLLTASCLALLLPACDGGPDKVEDGGAEQALSAEGPPLETEAPNGAGYKAAFAGQTRAPGLKTNLALDVRTAVSGLEMPWALEFLPDGRMLVSERPGRIRIASSDGRLSAAATGLPAVDHEGQGGLLDVAVDPDFATNSTIYWSYAEPRPGGNGTALAKARLVMSGSQPRLEDVRVLFRQQPTLESDLHFGSRIVFARDGTLFLTLGERSIPTGRRQAQDLGSHLGKIVRIDKDGSVPPGNPFAGREGARPEIWSYGHRNVQGAALHPATGELWTIEHGPAGGDELNVPQAGRNYGWPVIVYGMEYGGEPIGEGRTAQPGMEQPIYYWDPVIAPSGMLFYTGDLFPAWKGSLFVGGLASSKLVRLRLDGRRVTGEEWLLQDLGERIRDVRQGPDGAIYVVVEGDEGRILRLTPKS